MTGHTFATVVKLAGRTESDAVRSILDVFAARAVARSGTDAHLIAFVMAVLALLRVQLVNAAKGDANRQIYRPLKLVSTDMTTYPRLGSHLSTHVSSNS